MSFISLFRRASQFFRQPRNGLDGFFHSEPVTAAQAVAAATSQQIMLLDLAAARGTALNGGGNGGTWSYPSNFTLTGEDVLIIYPLTLPYTVKATPPRIETKSPFENSCVAHFRAALTGSAGSRYR